MKAIGIDEIKKLYPDEWVLLGNHEKDTDGINVIAGIPIYHSRDKREVAFRGKDMVTNYDRFTLIYTGQFEARRKITSLFKQVK
ncbi:MAG TPA: hypothetical protein VE978_17135 [Chitinophagales bacterium]|nr:hypothetical protein [Chitinophagales bacterium]